jgi:pyruvate-formate lyase-activating enzyme
MSAEARPDVRMRAGERRLSRRGVLWLGLRCDVRCKFCYDEHLLRRDKVWISVEEAAQALDKFRSFYRNAFVDFMGGEPTLHPHVLEIVRHAAAIGLRPTVITHGMRLADRERAAAYADAGIHDFLVSIHGIGDTAEAIHRRGTGNFDRQMRGLDNLQALGIPFRFNVTMIRDNLTQLPAIAALAGEKGARVVNFLTFNPYFEWTAETEIDFQPRHSEVAPHLAQAIDTCSALGIEANVRYMPPCQLPGREAHVYTGYQLPYDQHEWDYNSWYDMGHPGAPDRGWYLDAAGRQRDRHHYRHVPACGSCALRAVCDGFHAQYAARWGGAEARPYPGATITDPCHFINQQPKVEYQPAAASTPPAEPDRGQAAALDGTQFQATTEHRAGVRRTPAAAGDE